MLTAAEIAAYLGISASGVRQVIRRRKIKPAGQRWKAYVYDPDDILRHTGNRDRLAS
jgi:predicted site-specific integrase-resolvase